MKPDEFIKMIVADAQACTATTHLPLAAIIAVPALETGWGRTLLQQGVNTHNLFNIKGKGPAGQFPVESIEWLTMQEWKYLEDKGVSFTLTGESDGDKYAGLLMQYFRMYSSYTDSYNDFYAVLCAMPRYRPALRARDAFWFCTALQSAGFATDPHYAEKLHLILRKRVIPALEDLRRRVLTHNESL